MLATLTWDTFSSIQVHPGFQALVASGQEHHGQRRSQRNDNVHSPCPDCSKQSDTPDKACENDSHLNLQAERKFTY